MEQLKKISRIILPEFLYNFIRIIYRIFSKRLISAFFQSFFFKKKIDYINQNLIIISQIQRSGGTLLTQLFDNHSTLYSYPSELMLTSPKFNWQKDFRFSTIIRECSKAVPSSQGMNEAFSTGSQNHQPPHPNS